MLVSVHIPKTAGTSFLDILKAHFGSALIQDYPDRPFRPQGWSRDPRMLIYVLRHKVMPQRTPCVHGHFDAAKYASDPGAVLVTWLRDPVERIASHYHYWRRLAYRRDPGSLHRRMVEEEWSLERFCLCEDLRNSYCRLLAGVPEEMLAFVGIVEHFDSDLAYFCDRFLGAQYLAEMRNANARKGAKRSYFEDPALRDAVARHHRRDVDLYHRMLDRRAARIAAA